MAISTIPPLGCSSSISRVFEEHDAPDVGGPSRDAFHINPFIFLSAFEVYAVAFWETLQQFSPVPIGLVFKVFRLEKYEFALAFQDTGVETVEEIAVTPFANKGLGMAETMDHQSEGGFAQGFDFQYLLLKYGLGGVVGDFQIEPLERIVSLLPDGGEVQRKRHGVVQLAGIVALERLVKLFGVVDGELLCPADKVDEAEGEQEQGSFHGEGVGGLERKSKSQGRKDG